MMPEDQLQHLALIGRFSADAEIKRAVFKKEVWLRGNSFQQPQNVYSFVVSR